MITAKDIVIKQIDSHTANEFVRRVHYSGKTTPNSQLHLGVFLNGRLEGVMQFGPSLDKRKIQGLVKGTQWHEFIELNRLAFTDVLPRNSESRALSIAWRLLRKYAPQVKWVVSFADATQCGDGTIYRAAGFILTQINGTGNTLRKLPSGEVVCRMAVTMGKSILSNNGKADWPKDSIKMTGFQLRYIYFLDPSYRTRLTVPELPYSEIERRGAGMYKGIKRGTGETDNAAQSNAQTGGASPTVPLSNGEIA